MVSRINANIFSNNKPTDISQKVRQYVHVVPHWKIQLNLSKVDIWLAEKAGHVRHQDVGRHTGVRCSCQHRVQDHQSASKVNGRHGCWDISSGINKTVDMHGFIQVVDCLVSN